MSEDMSRKEAHKEVLVDQVRSKEASYFDRIRISGNLSRFAQVGRNKEIRVSPFRGWPVFLGARCVIFGQRWG